MKDGTTANQREIVLVPFPFSDLSTQKKRPALIISNNEFNKHSEDVICCMITSNPQVQESCVKITQKDLESGKLFYDSKIKPSRLFILNKRIIDKHLGFLSKEKSLLVQEEIKKLIFVD